MNIDYLDLMLSACFSLRKIRMITIQQGEKTFNLRPQIHVMLVSPFGTFKSSLTKNLQVNYGSSVVPMDTFSKPGLEGTISKDGDYIPPFLMNLGGKLLIIDEWNSLDFFAQESLLSTLENQRWARTLGFKVRNPFTFKNKFGTILVRDNVISGDMIFSCIAYAMYYPAKSQVQKALLSRFTPLFIQPNLEYMKANTSGNFEINVRDCSQNIDKVYIPDEVYSKFHEAFYDYVVAQDLVPPDTDDYGFVSRAMSDIIRFGVYNYMYLNITEEKEIIVDDANYFISMFPFATTLIHQFANPKTRGKVWQYRALLRKYPKKPKEFYANILAVSRQAIYDYDKILLETTEIIRDKVISNERLEGERDKGEDNEEQGIQGGSD